MRCFVFPPEPPVAIAVMTGPSSTIKGAPVVGAACEPLIFGLGSVRQGSDGGFGGNTKFPLVSSEQG